MDCHSRELDLGAELAAHPNDTQLTEVKTCHKATTAALQMAHLDSISAPNHEAIAEEGQKCQAFTRKFSAALQVCLPGEPLCTHVPPTTLVQWHSHSPPLRGASHSTTTGHKRHRVHPGTSHLEHTGHSSASNWY